MKEAPTKVNRFKPTQPSSQDTTHQDRGIVYVAHLPHGFVEEGLYQYFQQFGKVTKVKLARSRNTARSRGYGWVQFEYKEIAQMAAQAINGYIMHGKQVKAQYIDPTVNATFKNPFQFKKGIKKYRFVDWQQKFITKRNATKSQEELKTEVTALLAKEEEKRAKLKQMGIDFDFPGFRALLKQ